MKTMNFLVFGMILLLVGFVSAEQNLLVVGKIYTDTSFLTPLADSEITVSCLHDVIITNKTVNSSSDGLYGVIFALSECDMADDNEGNITIFYKSGAFAMMVATLVGAEDNPVTPSSGSGSSGGGSNTKYVCEEWSECIDGLQTQACNNNTITSKNCTVEIEGEVEELDVSGFSFEDQEADVSGTGGFFSTITGAVTGVNGAQATGIVAALIFILLIVGFIIVRKKKLKK